VPRVILQPAGGPDAARHFAKTIRTPVRFSDILNLLDGDHAECLAKLYPTGWLRIWGVTAGANGVNRRKWLQFAAGDRVLFCGQNRVFASGALRYRINNRQLALALWGVDSEGQTWEYVYFVGELRDQNIRYDELAKADGYSPAFVVLAVSILDGAKSNAVLGAFDLADD